MGKSARKREREAQRKLQEQNHDAVDSTSLALEGSTNRSGTGIQEQNLEAEASGLVHQDATESSQLVAMQAELEGCRDSIEQLQDDNNGLLEQKRENAATIKEKDEEIARLKATNATQKSQIVAYKKVEEKIDLGELMVLATEEIWLPHCIQCAQVPQADRKDITDFWKLDAYLRGKGDVGRIMYRRLPQAVKDVGGPACFGLVLQEQVQIRNNAAHHFKNTEQALQSLKSAFGEDSIYPRRTRAEIVGTATPDLRNAMHQKRTRDGINASNYPSKLRRLLHDRKQDMDTFLSQGNNTSTPIRASSTSPSILRYLASIATPALQSPSYSTPRSGNSRARSTAPSSSQRHNNGARSRASGLSHSARSGNSRVGSTPSSSQPHGNRAQHSSGHSHPRSDTSAQPQRSNPSNSAPFIGSPPAVGRNPNAQPRPSPPSPSTMMGYHGYSPVRQL